MGYKRSAPDAPDTSDDDGSQPERGKEAEAAGPKLDEDQAERQRNKKLRRDGEARNLSREERIALLSQDDGHPAAERGDGATGERCQAWSLLNSA